MKTKFENGQQGNEGRLKKSGRFAVLCSAGSIVLMSLAVVLLLLGHDTARFLVPVGLGMTTAGLMIRADGMKGEKEDEKRN
ncbi:MAG: hypothetical protein K2N29_00215 [Ruminiclostridium sp.]|nr:hypothetical protein [Ruminiclostridium sp.]